MSLSITNTTKIRLPKADFDLIAEEVLGNKYDLSLVIVGDKKAREINKTYRNKTYIPNVLSFPLSDVSGEIFLNLKKAKTEAPSYDMNYSKFVIYLFIHSLLHLKGYDHGSTMEDKERKILERFTNYNVKNNRMRH